MNFEHQRQLFDPAAAGRVAVIGVGSVGSWVVEFLVRLGVRDIDVWDHDSVTSHNVPMSCYRPSDVGRYKVDALRDHMIELGIELKTHVGLFTGALTLSGVTVISCVDTMESREFIWETVCLQRVGVTLFCDSRVAASYLEVYAVDPRSRDDARNYQNTLFLDEEAPQQLCGQHGIVHTATRAAGIIVSNVARYWMTGQKEWLVIERCDRLERVI